MNNVICPELSNSPDFLLTLVPYWHNSFDTSGVILVHNAVRRDLAYDIVVAVWVGLPTQSAKSSPGISWAPAVSQPARPWLWDPVLPAVRLVSAAQTSSHSKLHVVVWFFSRKMTFSHSAVWIFSYAIIHAAGGSRHLAKTAWFW